MDYYINSEVAHEFNVSNTTVSRWIEASQEKKNNLQIVMIQNKFRLLRNKHNRVEIERLKDEGNKYRSNISCARIEPKKRFYEIFKDKEIVEIINTIETNKEIPNKYTFKGDGSQIWDLYYKENAFDEKYPTPSRVIRLLDKTLDYLFYKSKDVKYLNVFDVAQGNSYPSKEFLEKINNNNKLCKYIAVDISPEMNEISKKNIANWFPNTEFKSYIADVESDNLAKILYESKMSEDEGNIILYIGSTIGLHEDKKKVFTNFRDSMGQNDLFIFSNTVNSSVNQADFSYVKNPNGDEQNLWIPRLLGIEVDNCEIISKYVEKINSRVMNLRLDKDYVINFNFLNKEKKVYLYKGEEVTLWRHQMTDVNEITDELKSAGLQILQITLESDLSHVLVMCQAVS